MGFAVRSIDGCERQSQKAQEKHKNAENQETDRDMDTYQQPQQCHPVAGHRHPGLHLSSRTITPSFSISVLLVPFQHPPSSVHTPTPSAIAIARSTSPHENKTRVAVQEEVGHQGQCREGRQSELNDVPDDMRPVILKLLQRTADIWKLPAPAFPPPAPPAPWLQWRRSVRQQEQREWTQQKRPVHQDGHSKNRQSQSRPQPQQGN